MKHIFLLNSFSLKEETIKVKEIIEKICKEEKIDYKIEINSNEKSTEEIMGKYQKTNYIILPVGGDGTINRVLNKIAGTNNILGYIPAGTGNDFYRSNKELLKPGIHKIDLIKINDNYFINVACFGIDAEIGNHSDIIHSKWIPKKHRYNASLLKHFMTYKPRKMKVTIEEKEIDKEFTTIIICNARYYGGGYKVGPLSSLQDGLMEVYLVEKTNRINMLGLICGIKYAFHENSKKVEKFSTTSISISTEKEIEANIDGEVLKSNQFEVKLIPKGIKISYNKSLIERIEKNMKKEKK